AAPENLADPGHLHAIIDSQDLDRVRDRECRYVLTMPVEDFNQVSEQVFLLRVVSCQLAEALEQLGTRKTQDAGTDFADLPLRGRTDLFLHNGAYRARLRGPRLGRTACRTRLLAGSDRSRSVRS